jgi:hypothetical protein
VFLVSVLILAIFCSSFSTPSHPNWSDPWTNLHGDGFLDFLIVQPTFAGADRGTFTWNANFTLGSRSAKKNFVRVNHRSTNVAAGSSWGIHSFVFDVKHPLTNTSW